MCITAYNSTYLKMTSEETSAENSELVIKSLGGQVICLRLLMRLLVHYTMPAFLAPACNHEACYAVVQCRTPRTSHTKHACQNI